MNKLLRENLGAKSISQSRYRQLFTAIIILYVVSTFFDFDGIGEFLMGLSFLSTILLAIRTFPLSHPIKIIFRILTILAFGTGIVQLLITPEIIRQSLDILSSIIYASFLSLSILFLNRQLLLEKSVNQDTILGGISIYLLLGILWYLIYRVIYLVNQNAFSIEVGNSSYDLLYFSFTTLTTLGYGDISPISKVAQGFTNIEAIIGQLYPAIFLARLVSLYTDSESD